MIKFAHPDLLFILLIIPLLVIFYLYMLRRKKQAIAEFGNPTLLGPLMPLQSYKRETWKFAVIMVALLFIIVGAAAPQYGSKLKQIKKEGVELMIVLDVSNSMMAEDIKPNRLEKAKLAIARMIEKLTDDKVGLIVFAGNAYIQLPITTDYSAARLFLSGINTDMVPVQGTAIGEAIERAVGAFTPQTETSKAVIVITDGENHQDDAMAAAKSAREHGVFVHTIGMGLEQGAPIPVKGANGQYMQDSQGNVVISKLDENTLQQIAAAGEGMYVRASNSDVGLGTLLDEINQMQKSELEERVFTDYDEKYQYFLCVGLLFLVIEFIILGRKNKRLMKIHFFNKTKSVNN